jgi:prepilin-type N-terminal cleavage/methylation domain-containing protein
MKNPRRSPRRRAGFTLAELMIVVVLIGVIGGALTSLLVRQQRFHRAIASVTDSRARMRDVATILPTDLRSISTVGKDILALSLTSMQFRAFVGTSIVCRLVSTTVVDIPPKVLASGNVLTAWINPPVAGDIGYIYDEGQNSGNADDSWVPFTISSVASAVNTNWCPTSSTFTTAGDAGATSYEITADAAPATTRVQLGSVLRFAREVRYSIYQGADGQWYVGYERCTPNADRTLPGICANREVLAGPVQPATTDAATSGLYFLFYDQNGGQITDVANAAQIARVDVGIRTTSESLRRAASNTNLQITGGDSLKFTVGFRNRI